MGKFNVKSKDLQEKSKWIINYNEEFARNLDILCQALKAITDQDYWAGPQANKFHEAVIAMFYTEERAGIAKLLREKSKSISDFLDMASSNLERLESDISKGVKQPFVGEYKPTLTFNYVDKAVIDSGDLPDKTKEDDEDDTLYTDDKIPTKLYGYLDFVNYNKNVWIRDAKGNKIKYDEAAAKERAVLVAKYLVSYGGYTKEQAAALAGVYWGENRCDPGEIMQAEYKSGGSYGAGIASWTDPGFKKQTLIDAGYDPNTTKIEDLNFKQQCDAVIAVANNSNEHWYGALKRCDTIEDASATAVCLIGGYNYSNNWKTHPTTGEAKALADAYATRNDRIYGYSAEHHDLDQKRLALAKEVLAEL